MMNWGKFHLNSRNQLEEIFMALGNRETRRQRRDERRLAEQRTTKHRVQSRNSCIADARSYRVARRFPVSAIAQLGWK